MSRFFKTLAAAVLALSCMAGSGPAAARFLSVDPVPANPNTGADFNRYDYANNNPYKFTDKDGRESACFSTGVGCGLTPITPEIQQKQAVAMVGLAATVLTAGAGSVVADAVVGEVAAHGLIGAALGNPATVATATVAVADGAAAVASGGGAPSPTIVTPAKIEAALADSTMQTTQRAVSLPVVQRYTTQLEGGSAAPAIKAADGVIVDGNHRYIAGRIAGQEPAVQPGVLSPSQAGQVQPIQNIKVDPVDWGNQ